MSAGRVTPELRAHRRKPIDAVARSESDGPADREEKRIQRLNSMPVWSNFVAVDQPPSEAR